MDAGGAEEQPSVDVSTRVSQTNGCKILQVGDNDAAADSFGSSMSAVTEQSEASSSFGSSKATTPIEIELTKLQRDDKVSQRLLPKTYHRGHERLSFTVRPKSSIPTDIPAHQHAAECLDAAESSRLNPYALNSEEYHLLRHHISHNQVTTYLNIRNAILRVWLQKPWAIVTRQEAVGCANARWFDAANVCYDWLVRRGYINYGCVKLADVSMMKSRTLSRRKRRKIAVIGAGVSGLACARQLEGLFKQYAERFHDMGEDIPNVVLLEGRSRVGGRVYSREFKTKLNDQRPELEGKRHTAEIGGMIITGFERGNPINVLVRGQLGLPYHALTAETTIYDSNGKPVDPIRDKLVEKLYNDCLDRVSEYKFKSQPSKVIEGNRDLLYEGRDSPGDGSKTIMQAEEATAALPYAPPVSEQSVPEKIDLVPVSADKLTGRVHNQPGVPASEKVAEKARMMGWSLKPGASEDFDLNLGDAASRNGSTLGSVLDHGVTRYKDLVDLTPQDYRLLNWHIANLEYSNAANLHNLSLELWDIDAGNEWEGNHTMVVGGYQSIARGLLQCPTPLDLSTKFAVKAIKFDSTGFAGPATIESEDGVTVCADNVVCSVPLGVLKQGSINFEPALPAWKTGAIERLGFGILNKVVLVYDKVFWDSERHIFGVLRDPPDRHSTLQEDYALNRGRFFQWFNVTHTTGLPCLIALMAGEAGFETERSSNESLIEEATEILRGVFGNKVPYPVESVITRWGSDRFARGSYSSAAPGMQPDDYDSMARPVGNLVFAGEHTIGTHPATVHGAYLSGLRAASEVLESILGPIEVPTPLILPRDSLLLQKRKEAAKDPRQARLEAYELEVWDHIRDKIGERPLRPNKVAGSAYLLFGKAHLEEARRRCEENRKPGRARSFPNEVRMMTSKMWKETPPEQRQPYEEQAAEQKRAYNTALEVFNAMADEWDQKAVSLRAEYESAHPSVPGPEELREDQGTPNKYRRAKQVSYAEGRDPDTGM
ncbi:vacuolar protein sorting 33A-like protein [Metarhizium album ARSEF 1941]|uniref:Vacuolar protein sorting 33A-like protein n=1 Tax=Metarhizium album (strain ARSEF 1941) TaxID=1081103 RepID=A0A0B2WTL6_METAS|nr:vacuolar protein sorting 33A-like protein [Metarhizium album ARSEF 1941]KHN96255.1 vacuolar protein sorting 33A-like protein [Metarhizium album ARSEF 1941]